MHTARTELKTEQVPIIVGFNKGNLGNCEVRLFSSLRPLRPNFLISVPHLGCWRTSISDQDVQVDATRSYTSNAIILT